MDFSGVEVMNHSSGYALHTYNNPSVGMPTEWRHELFGSEFGSHSDISSDTTVHTTDSSMGKEKRSIHSDLGPYCGSAFKQFGNCGIIDDETLNELLFLKALDSTLYSDEEMTFNQSTKQETMDEQEELRYMAELIYQDAAAEYYNDCHLQSSRDIYLNTEPAPWTQSNFFPDFDNEPFPDVDEAFRCQSRNEFHHAANNTHKVISSQHSGAGGIRQTAFAHENAKRAMRKVKEVRTRFPKYSLNIRDRPRKIQQNKTSPSDSNPAAFADQKVFLGGLPLGMNERELRNELAAQGYKVLRRPKILRGFAPEVMMRSVAEAKELVEKGTININGFTVEVRSFNSYNKRSKSRKIPNVEKRSVFLGGLPIGTKVQDIMETMKKLDVRVVNYPVIKFGFSPQVIMQSFSQARKLIQMKNVLINGKFVEVKPYATPRNMKRVN